jgi:hypothetical protein
MGYIMNFKDDDSVEFIKDGQYKNKKANKKKFKNITKIKKKSKKTNRK